MWVQTILTSWQRKGVPIPTGDLSNLYIWQTLDVSGISRGGKENCLGFDDEIKMS